MIAALTATIIAPAQAGSSGEPLLPATSATFPKVATPQLLDPEAEPILSQPEATDPQDQADDAEPAVAVTAPLSDMVAQLRGSEAGSRELECLAGAIYFESKSESLTGQLAVGHVIANRAASGRFPSSYCGVVYQRSQFSFVRGHSMPYIPRASQDWKDAVAIAKIVDQKLQPSPMGKALYFHARRVSPGWRMARVGTLGNHVFYR